MSKYKIKDVQATVVQGNFHWPLVKITANDETVGYGEAYGGDRPEGEGPYVRKMILDIMKPRLIGEDPFDIERLTAKLGLQFNVGPKAYAISAVQMALLDLVGHILNTPVYNLLGGKFTDEVRVYADCHGGHLITSWADYDISDKRYYTPEAFAETAKRVKKMGYTILKFDLYPNLAYLAPVGPSETRPDLVYTPSNYQVPGDAD